MARLVFIGNGNIAFARTGQNSRPARSGAMAGLPNVADMSTTNTPLTSKQRRRFVTYGN